MAVPRPLLLALVGVVLLSGAFVATRNMRHEKSTPSPQPVQRKAVAHGPAAARAVHSGRFRLSLAFTELSDRGHSVRSHESIAARGAFQGRGPKRLPDFSIDLSLRESKRHVDVGARSVAGSGYVAGGGRVYAVPRRLLAQTAALRARVGSSADRRGAGAGPGLLGFTTANVRGLRRLGTQRVDGVDTEHLAGAVDGKRLLRGFAGDAGTLLGLKDRVVERVTVPKAQLDVYVGRSDGAVRRARLRAAIEDPKAKGERFRDYRHTRVAVSWSLTGVNRPQRIERPAAVSRKPVSTLGPVRGYVSGWLFGFASMRIDHPGIAAARAALQPGSASPAGGGRDSRRGANALEHALARGRAVVLFFFQPGALDDAATRRAVAAVRAKRGVTVVEDRISNLGAYGRFVQDTGVNQTPSIVLISADRRAKLIEGYVDAETLRQELADLRR